MLKGTAPGSTPQLVGTPHKEVKEQVFREGPGTEAMCDAEIDKHRLALRLARRFNKLVPDPRGKITFTLPMKSTVESLAVGQYLTRHRHGRHLDKLEWVLIEENLVRQGEYQVFIGKSGETLEKSPTTLDAFLHFTYHESGRKFLLCGFQGVQTEHGYTLTTPCIHSEDNSFGSATDGGPKMMRKVFDQHVCNNLCYSYERPSEISAHADGMGTDDLFVSGDDSRDDTDEDKADESFDLIEKTSSRTGVGDGEPKPRHGDPANGCDEVFLANSTAKLKVVVNGVEDDAENGAEDAPEASHGSSGLFSLGESTSENLAYCCTDFSKETMDEIEEEQRKVQKERAESESKGESSDLEFRRIHLGDQIREEKPRKPRKKFDKDAPTHRCNVQAIGGIEKRPSI
ncbi:alpha-protein kinase vwka-like [Plakobranchus ocellatus]|uniref:Alpha-protein kinase vwka-like n=1 Tax=Plakobranchus ocellatus TaxID=259542 RepID=A0AAV4CFG3_9GAST|nr:alpha-protein kinase vwka-like [Plakobranchus ocellatus]